MKEILLLDMDGVLLEPHGYHRALQKTVRLVGESLGYRTLVLEQEFIFRFEAVGITSEWDSSAICLGLMLKALWLQGMKTEIPRQLGDRSEEGYEPPRPDWGAFFGALDETSPAQDPLEKALCVLQGNLPTHRQRELAQLLERAHEVHRSLTHRTFQELVLGSKIFAKTYGLSPHLDTAGYLSTHDHPTLSPSQTKALQKILTKNRKAVIFTNRPSLPPGREFGTPEAELGAQIVGLESLPLVGYGDMLWAAENHDLNVNQCRKPSPVHALAALLTADGMEKRSALGFSTRMIHQRQRDPVWGRLEGAHAYVFEDTPAGVKSLLNAQRVLDDAGVQLNVFPVGIAVDKVKGAALSHLGAAVYPDLPSALSELVELR